MDFSLAETPKTTNLILCCECGTEIEPNASNMCVSCIRTQVDITEGIPKQAVLYFCRNCNRYLQPPNTWITAQLESKELLSICLKKLKGLSKVRLVDAGFVWTEPHSMRIKVKLTVQKEVLNGAVLQQVFVVEFTVNNNMCDDCHRVEAKDFWRAVVQIRQKTDHKKTFFFLEQLILRHKAHANTVNIKAVHDGLDFFYSQKQDARKLVDFLVNVVPCRYQSAQELVSHDVRNNTFTYKYTFSVEIVPICKDNIVCLPAKLAQMLGNISPICICTRVTQSVHVIDPNTLQVADLSGTQFWRYPFVSLCSPKRFVEFMVMQVDITPEKDRPHRVPVSHKVSDVAHGPLVFLYSRLSQSIVIQYIPPRMRKSHIHTSLHVLADLWVSKVTESGLSDQQYFCRTHLGHLLNAGDTVLGFDFTNANLNNFDLEKVKADKLPDVVIVKKVFGDKTIRNRKRRWKLKHLHDDLHMETASNERDYTDFLEDLEEDQTTRQLVNIYKDDSKMIAVDTDDTDDEGLPQISLQEMLDDLCITDDPMGDED